jgi:signal transduction histidine kinase
VAWLAAWPAGVALGAAAAVIAHRNPDYAVANTAALIAVELLAGLALIACGLESWRRRPGRRFAALLAAGGCGWFLLAWNNPGVGSPVVFTIGLVLYAAAPPLIAHALLAYPTGPLRRLERAVVAAAYGGSLLLLGLLPALVFDPAAEGCSECPRNLALIHGNASLYQDFNRAGIYLGLAWTATAVALLGWRLARSTAALRALIAPVVGAGSLYLSSVAAEFVASLRRGYVFSNDPLDRRLWLAAALALVLLALAIAWSWLHTRRTRTRLARLVLELVETPSPGGLEHALAGSLGDPELRLSYPLDDGRYVNANGQPQQPGATSTALLRDGAEVALLTHKPGLLDDGALAEELAAAARLGLENERLHAELLAQLADLRASRARIVTTGDAERRRLERDLHDGAQQRLVALTLELRIARIRLEPEPGADPTLVERAQQAEDQLRDALAALRKLAAGIFPAVLADEGLAAAIEALAEETEEQLRIVRIPEGRLPPAVETTAYRIVSETLNHAHGHPITLTAFTEDGLLVIELESARVASDLAELEDRVGALDGTLELACTPRGHARIRAEIPCAS